MQHHLFFLAVKIHFSSDVLVFYFHIQIAQKYDMQKEEELRFWIEEVTGMPIGDNFQKGLKDGVILCE